MKFSPGLVPPFRHLQRLTDTVGLVARTDGIVPRHGDGYRVDDVARGLVVVCREPSPSAELITLGRRYLYFLTQAQAADGKFRSRLRRRPPVARPARSAGCLGRSLWALGTPAARGPTADRRRRCAASPQTWTKPSVTWNGAWMR